MHAFTKRLGLREVTINVNGDWSGDALIKLRRLKTTHVALVVDTMVEFSVNAAGLCAGHDVNGTAPNDLSLLDWGVVVAAAVEFRFRKSAIEAMEDLPVFGRDHDDY